MSRNKPRSGRTSTIILILLLVTALFTSGGVYYLATNVVDEDFDFHLDISPTNADVRALLPEETAIVAQPEPKDYTISMVGDCTLASSQRENGFDSVIAEKGLDWPFSGTVDILSADDFTLANLECTLSDTHLTSGSTFAFRGPTENAQILVSGSVEAVTNGNNHTPDFGAQGEADSRAAVEAADVGYLGPDEAKIFATESGLKIGVYCPGWNNATLAGVEEVIPALREDGADVVIYAPHWGREGKYHPTDEQQLVAHAAIDAGADIVCGTHPHVLQRCEEYNGGMIFYSLANYSFGGNNAPRDRDTVIAQVTITQDADGKCAVTGYTLIPCCLSSTEGVNDFCPVPYDEDDEGYARALSKLDVTYSGPDLNVDSSFLYS